MHSEKIADCRVFTVHKTLSMKPYGRESHEERMHNFYVFHSGDWVNVIPVTDEGEVVLIEQYRHGTEEFTLEIPGGSIDPEDPTPLHAAARELLEETGYEAESWVQLGVSHPNPAIQSNACHTYLAKSIRQVQIPNFTSTEEVAIRRVPLTQIPELIKNGSITHALGLVAFFWLQLARLDSTMDLPGAVPSVDNCIEQS